MKDVLLIPDSRCRQAQMKRNRLLEQNMKHLATIQRLTMQEKKGDLESLTVAITRLATSITQLVRLHHQIWRDDASPDDVLAAALRLSGLDGSGAGTEETP
jgi:hypothetical protein